MSAELMTLSPFVRFEAGDVRDGTGTFLGPPDTDAHTGVHGIGTGSVKCVQKGGIGTVEPNQHPGEGRAERLTTPGFMVPGPGGDRPGGPHLDEITYLLGGNGVVLDGRDKDPPVTGLHPEDDTFAEAGEKGTLDRTEGTGEGKFEDERGFEYFGHGILLTEQLGPSAPT
jgi:hypothetical protein